MQLFLILFFCVFDVYLQNTLGINSLIMESDGMSSILTIQAWFKGLSLLCIISRVWKCDVWQDAVMWGIHDAGILLIKKHNCSKWFKIMIQRGQNCTFEESIFLYIEITFFKMRRPAMVWWTVHGVHRPHPSAAGLAPAPPWSWMGIKRV